MARLTAIKRQKIYRDPSSTSIAICCLLASHFTWRSPCVHLSQLGWGWSQYNSLSIWDIRSLSGRNLISMLSSPHLPQPQDFWEATGTTHTSPQWSLAWGGSTIAVPLAVIQDHTLWQPEPPNKLWKSRPPEELRNTEMGSLRAVSRRESPEELKIS